MGPRVRGDDGEVCAKNNPHMAASFARCETSLGSRWPQNEEKAMRRTVIRYKTKPEMSDRNAELVAAVFAELQAAQPEGFRYLSLRLEDDTFIHFVETAADDGSSAL